MKKFQVGWGWKGLYELREHGLYACYLGGKSGSIGGSLRGVAYSSGDWIGEGHDGRLYVMFNQPS